MTEKQKERVAKLLLGNLSDVEFALSSTCQRFLELTDKWAHNERKFAHFKRMAAKYSKLSIETKMMQRTRMWKSWKEDQTRQSSIPTWNESIRSGLIKIPAFKVKARKMGIRPEVDPATYNRMTDDLEVEAFMAKAKNK